MQARNISAIATATVSALKAGDSLYAHCVELQALFAGATKDEVRGILLPIVAQYQGIQTKVQSSGRIVMQGEKQAVNTATVKLNRLVTAIIGKEDGLKDELEVPEDILAAAKALWALCSEYEQAGKLCATAIAKAKV